MSTSENLKAAFAGESQANRKYLAFSRQAEEEGYHQVAKLFRAAAEAETVHALNHAKVMGIIGDTISNLKAAIEGETYENKQMYPDFIKEAEAEGNQKAAISFKNANAVEQIHAQLYQKALDHLGKNQSTTYYVCQVCGNTVEGEAPETCPICKAKREAFKKID
jgi:rubrerythrin